MKVLVAVISYSGDAANGAHDAIRNTWGKDIYRAGADLRFFIGDTNPSRSLTLVPKSDEVFVNRITRFCGHNTATAVEGCCVDIWQYEIREMLKWSLQQDYDFTFLCCNDTYVIPHKLMASGFEKYDYSGRFIPRDWRTFDLKLGEKCWRSDIYGEKLYLWADAGIGWFMSRKAAEIVASVEPNCRPGDIHLGQLFGPRIASGEILAGDIFGCVVQTEIGGYEGKWNGITWHYREIMGKAYKPESGWMKEMYAEHGSQLRLF